MSVYTQEQFTATLPNKPYCTNDLTAGLIIRPAEKAIKMRYIQPNTPTDLRWLVFDIDRSSAHYDWQDLHVPAPNFTVMNPGNGHAHLYYGLEMPVYMQMGARSNPIRYASAIDVAMTSKLDADPAYAKLIAKNPFHDYWNTMFWREESYQLEELADWLDLSAYSDARQHLPEMGLGRNCNLFDLTRFWAYKAIRKPVENYLFEELYGPADFVARCIQYADSHNFFPDCPKGEHLSDREVYAIGKSVGNWVFSHMSPAGFREWAEKRRKRSIDVRHQKSEDRRSEALELRSKGKSKIEIASIMGLSYRQVLRLLKM